MSGMEGNPHATEAYKRLDGVHEWQAEQGATDETMQALALDAQAEATLALAYEQRTANLMAWVAAMPERWTADLEAEMFNRLGQKKPESEPVKHHRTGPGKCNCGFDAYKIRGIMIDYRDELQAHLRSVSS